MIRPSCETFDVAVIGGGPSGIAAAIASATLGRSTCLIEKHSTLGGMGTVALVNNFCPAHWDGTRFIIGGVFGRIRERLIERRALYQTGSIEPYDPEVYADEIQTQCEDAGVTVYLQSATRQVNFKKEIGAEILLADGTPIHASTVVDATADAVIAAAAGVPTRFGRSRDQAVMPLTYCYMMGPVNIEAVRARMPSAMRHDALLQEDYVCVSDQPAANERVRVARAAGDLTIPRDHVSLAMSIPGRPEYLTVNFGRVPVKDPTDPAQLAVAEEFGRAQVAEGIRFFRKYIPGFENVELISLARQIGVRQTRQIVGLYTLTADDIVQCRQFEDVIAQCWYPIDIHEPHSDRTTMHRLKDGTHYDIPWRCLIPAEGPANLVVAGRAISATHEAMSSFRVSPSVMAIGEAAGVTAALAAQKKVAVRDVDVAQVQARLLSTGGILA